MPEKPKVIGGMVEVKVRVPLSLKNELESYQNHPSLDELLFLTLKQYLLIREYQ